MCLRDLSLRIMLSRAVLASSPVGLEGQEPASPSPAECAVYSVVLDSLYRQVAEEAFLVNGSTIRRESLRWGPGEGRDLLASALESLSPLPDGLLADFEARNARRADLSNCTFQTRKPVVVLDGAEVEQIAQEVLNLDEYPARFPARGMATFSRVGFTPDMQSALVYEQFHCGGRCGGGQLVVLTRQDGCWAVERSVRVLTF